MAKINKEIAQSIINLYLAGESTYTIAKTFNLWNTSIGNIIRGTTWKNCYRPYDIKEIIEDRAKKSQFQIGRYDAIHNSLPPLTTEQKEILIGSMLGDGGLSKPNKNNSRLAKVQCKKFKEYVIWHNEVLAPYNCDVYEVHSKDKFCYEKKKLVHKKVKKRLVGYTFQSKCHPIFTEMELDWYKRDVNGNYVLNRNGKRIKILPNYVQLTPLTIAIWFCDDGHNNLKQRNAILCTQSFNYEETEKLCCDLAKNFSIFPKIKTVSSEEGGSQPIIYVSRTSYDNLISLIKPYVIWECFKYKINWKILLHQHEYSAKLGEDDVKSIFLLSEIFNNPQLGEMFGVHRNTISEILNRKSWSHLQHFNKRL